MEIQMGGGVFERRRAPAVLEIQVDGGVKNRAFRRGGVDFFWNNPLCIVWKQEVYRDRLDNVWKEDVTLLNPFPHRTPPQPTGFIKLFELKL